MKATKEGIDEFGFVSCRVNKQGAPEAFTSCDEAREVIDYAAQITREEGLPATMTWQKDGWSKVTQ